MTRIGHFLDLTDFPAGTLRAILVWCLKDAGVKLAAAG